MLNGMFWLADAAWVIDSQEPSVVLLRSTCICTSLYYWFYVFEIAHLAFTVFSFVWHLYLSCFPQDLQTRLTRQEEITAQLRDENSNLNHDIDQLISVISVARSSGHWEVLWSGSTPLSLPRKSRVIRAVEGRLAVAVILGNDAAVFFCFLFF